MAFTAVTHARLREAARLLASHGVHTPAIDEAGRREQWPPMLETQLVVDVHHHSAIASQLGVDIGLLPPVPDNAPQAGTIGQPAEPEPTLELPARMPQSAAEVVSPRGVPLDFDGQLDSLKGVPLADLDGVGEKNQQRLEKMGVRSVYDLLHHIPLRYLDRTELTPIAGLSSGMRDATFAGVVSDFTVRRGRTPYVRYTVTDAGRRVSCMFFRAMWMAGRFKKGDTVLVHGDVTDFNGSLTMSNPIIETLEDTSAPMVAVYPQSATHRVTTWLLRRAALDALRRIPRLDDPVPEALLRHRQLLGRLDAFRAMHVPANAAEANWGRERVVYDEFLRLQLSLGVMAHAKQKEKGISHKAAGSLLSQWREGLPYALTGAQDRAIAEVTADLRADRPMNRLLQGDVGAGKTAVLVGTALQVIEGGHQAVIVAPSEILARQHFEEMAEALQPLGIQVDLLVSKSLPRPRKQVLADLADGTCKLAVGTHSLLQPTVEYAALGAVIVDEQHRFGVDQRAALADAGPEGKAPDVLQATATPIPRTSAITQFGDMDVSILDEKPPGRSEVVTRWVESAPITDADCNVWKAIHDQVRQGRQAFVVCPLVTNKDGNASETKMAASAEATAEELANGALSTLRIGVVHGKLKPAERTERMAAYVAGEIDVLVATTVIEVGVSVPNATVMVMLDAQKFGLAQLHQLRGRVGRGRHPGQCWLVGEATGDGRERMEAMCSTTDGFELSAMDLQIRGPGALTSTAQAGKESGLQVANLIADEHIHLAARADAQGILSRDPQLLRNSALRNEVRAALGDDAAYMLKS